MENKKNDFKQYTLREKGAYYAHIAKGTTRINPSTGKPISEVERARARGWLTAQRQVNQSYKNRVQDNNKKNYREAPKPEWLDDYIANIYEGVKEL